MQGTPGLVNIDVGALLLGALDMHGTHTLEVVEVVVLVLLVMHVLHHRLKALAVHALFLCEPSHRSL